MAGAGGHCPALAAVFVARAAFAKHSRQYENQQNY
jgi:hypothetical protein